MDNTNRPKVQNMNDFVNGIENEAPKQAAEAEALSTSAQLIRPQTEKPVRTPRSQHVASGMRSQRTGQAGDAGSSQQRSASSAMVGTVNVRSQAERGTRPANTANAAREIPERPAASKTTQRPAVKVSPAKGKTPSGSRKYADIREERRNRETRRTA